MGLESGTYIDSLNASNPDGATDEVSTLDNHDRLIKSTIKNTFPNLDGAMTADQDELNTLDGFTGTTADLNLISGMAAGSLKVDAFPATTAMLFYQDAAPTGWTIVAAADEHSIRLTKGSVAGGQTGGVAANGGTNDFSSQFTAIDSESTVLDTTQIPAHAHTMDAHGHTLVGKSGTGDQLFQANFPFAADTSGGSYMTNAGTGTTNTAGVQATTATMQNAGGGLGHVHEVDLAVKWAPSIMATKDA